MNPFFHLILKLYLPIGTAVFVGIFLSWILSQSWVERRTGKPLHRIVPAYMGKFLFLIGVPIGVVNFIRKADLTGTIWLAPVVAWGAIVLGVLCAWLWLHPLGSRWKIPSRGSFTLVSMVGNTGYLGFPVILLLPQLGPDYFGWALLYDVLGTFFGAYGLGVILAAQCKTQMQTEMQLQIRSPVQTASDRLIPKAKETPEDPDPLDIEEALSSSFAEEAVDSSTVATHISAGQSFWRITKEVLKNPTLFAFVIGLALRSVIFPKWLDFGVSYFAWSVIMMSLVLMGIRLQQLDSWRSFKFALPAVGIKMFLVPLVVAMALTAFGMEGPPRLVLILQSAMPSAFATLVLAETYNLDRELVVTSLGLSSSLLLLMLPLWLWGFATW